MKVIGVIVACLAVVALALALAILNRRTPPADCTERVVIVKDPHGQTLECVCEAGVLSTCFNPGP